jgi:hypothetical protein
MEFRGAGDPVDRRFYDVEERRDRVRMKLKQLLPKPRSSESSTMPGAPRPAPRPYPDTAPLLTHPTTGMFKGDAEAANMRPSWCTYPFRPLDKLGNSVPAYATESAADPLPSLALTTLRLLGKEGHTCDDAHTLNKVGMAREKAKKRSQTTKI